jgi:L-aspartate oxidase
VRSDQRLDYAARNLAVLREETEHAYRTLRLTPDLVELRNIALVGHLIVECARRRPESRGLHYTLDHPLRSARLRRPTVLRRAAPERIRRARSA